MRRGRHLRLASPVFTGGGCWSEVASGSLVGGVHRAFGLRAVLIVGAAMAVSQPACAQYGGMAGGGPASAGQRFSATARADVTYDSNAAGGSQGLANLRGLTPQDVIYLASLSVMLNQPIGSQIAFLQATGGVDRHQNNPSLNSQNIDALGGLSGHLGACSATATGGYSRHQTEQSELVVVATTKNIAGVTSANGQVNCVRGHFLGGLSTHYSELRNSAQSSGYVNSTNSGIGASLGYASQQAGDISFVAQYGRTTYGTPAVPNAFKSPNFDSYSAGLTYKRKIGLRLSGETSVFYTTTTSRADGVLLTKDRTFNGLTANIGLHYKPTGRTGLDIQYNRSVQPSPTGFSAFSVSETGSITGTYVLTSRINFHLGGSIQRDDYGGAGATGTVSLPGVVQNDRRLQVSGGASLKVGRNAALDLNAEHSHRQSDVAAFNENDTRVILGVSSKF